MALTRKFLTAMGIEADKIDEIINAHSESVDALKEERDAYKDKAEKFDQVQKELDDANSKLKDFDKDGAYKVKYDAIKEEFDNFKKDAEAQKTKATKADAFKALLKEIGVSDKRLDSVVKVSDLDAIKLDKDGKIEGIADLKKSLSEEWADFIVKDGEQGANTASPPDSNGNGTAKTKKEIMEIEDTQERQKAWGEYIKNGGI